MIVSKREKVVQGVLVGIVGGGRKANSCTWAVGDRCRENGQPGCTTRQPKNRRRRYRN